MVYQDLYISDRKCLYATTGVKVILNASSRLSIHRLPYHADSG